MKLGVAVVVVVVIPKLVSCRRWSCQVVFEVPVGSCSYSSVSI